MEQVLVRQNNSVPPPVLEFTQPTAGGNLNLCMTKYSSIAPLSRAAPSLTTHFSAFSAAAAARASSLFCLATSLATCRTEIHAMWHAHVRKTCMQDARPMSADF
jgi:hypothetical protein